MGPPAGKVDDGETLKQAMVREVYEEADIKILEDKLEYFNKEYFVRHGNIDLVFHVFVLNHNDFVDVKVNNTEHVEHGWFSPQQALEMDLVEDEYALIKDYFNLN